MRALLSLVLVALAGAEQVFEDSHALTALWQATSSGSTDAFMSQLITNREHAQHRSNDGRGPMFWAMEFKNVDAFALLIHLEVDQNQEDIDGKKPREFFEGSEADFEEFHQDAKDKVTELGASLKAREEEFYSYQQSQADNVREAVPPPRRRPPAPPLCAATLCHPMATAPHHPALSALSSGCACCWRRWTIMRTRTTRLRRPRSPRSRNPSSTPSTTPMTRTRMTRTRTRCEQGCLPRNDGRGHQGRPFRPSRGRGCGRRRRERFRLSRRGAEW